MSFSSNSVDGLMENITALVDLDEGMYCQRHKFRMEKNDVIHLRRRISIDLNGYDNEDSIEFFYHIFFDRAGSIWWFIDEEHDLRLGLNTEIYWDKENDDDYRGYDSRRYCFKDCILPDVKNAVNLVIEALCMNKNDHDKMINHSYIWDPSEFNISRKIFKKGIRVNSWSCAEETNEYYDVQD